MASRLYAKVAVDKAAFHFDNLFDYLIPERIAEMVKPGTRVLVPFGQGNRRRQAMVMEISDKPDVSTSVIKPIYACLDEHPLVNDEMLGLIKYLKETTFCTYYEAVKTVLPSFIGFDISVACEANEDFDLHTLEADERAVFEYIKDKGGLLPRDRICEAFGLNSDSAVLKSLELKGAVLKTELAKRKVKDETTLTARAAYECADDIPPDIKLTAKQRELLDFLYSVGAASLKEIGYFTSVTQAVARALEKKGLVEIYAQKTLRKPAGYSGGKKPEIILTEEQQAAFEGISKLCRTGKTGVSLLYGVTGSGKTQVYIKLIEQVVASGKKAIVLVPEISLTPQTMEVFASHFGERVAILHSGLSFGERLDEFNRIKNRQADIAVGTRSAVFAPFENIGLIILDEEQEATYKSESSPRYHALEVAKRRAAYHNARLVLSSATPSIESYYRALTGRYNLFTLNERYGEANLPAVNIVDMASELREGVSGPISRILADEMEYNLKKGEQTILLLNRRGYNTLVKCSACQAVAVCPNCSIAFTYHSANGRLMCHYCGHSAELSAAKCTSCGGKLERLYGTGTQKLEEYVKNLFPEARVIRMDADTTMSKNAHKKGFDDFLRGDYDIMIGTQMVAKGLNFENVTLVGVLAADMSLFSDNFKSAERTFSLLTQVVGRSGRGQKAGRAYIQTHFPENDVIELAAAQNYRKFYENEIIARKIMLYPPFCHMCAVNFAADTEDDAKNAAADFLERLKETVKSSTPPPPVRLLGPSPHLVLKAGGKYRYKIVIKCKNDQRFRKLLASVFTAFLRENKIKRLTANVDMYFDGTF